MVDDHYGRTDSYISNLIRRKAISICRSLGLPSTDREEVESDLWTHLVERQSRYDPTLSSFETFADRVIGNKAKSIVRHQRAEKRCASREILSLQDLVNGLDGEELPRSETVADPKAATPDDIDREADVADFISRLSGIDAQVACLRLVGLNDIEIRSALGLKRRGLDRCLRNVERLAREMGLEEYLPRRTSPAGDGVDHK